jgi:hypothetical protein
MSRLARESAISQTFMQAGTAEAIIERERRRSQRLENPGKMHWKLAASPCDQVNQVQEALPGEPECPPGRTHE